MATTATTCQCPGCTTALQYRGGRPARFCSAACRVRAHRQRHADQGAVTVEADMGSATSRGRPSQRSWLVRFRRGERSVIVAHGLRRHPADRLVEQLTDLLA